MKWEGFGRKRSWTNRSSAPFASKDCGLSQNKLSQNSRCLDRDSNGEPSYYKSRARLICLMIWLLKNNSVPCRYLVNAAAKVKIILINGAEILVRLHLHTHKGTQAQVYLTVMYTVNNIPCDWRNSVRCCRKFCYQHILHLFNRSDTSHWLRTKYFIIKVSPRT
jgi:hypothetical protein